MKTRYRLCLLLAALVLTVTTACQKNKTIALTLLTPPGIDTLVGVTKLNVFVDNSTTGLSLPVSDITSIDQLVDVESDNLPHVLTIEALNANELVVARGRTRRIIFTLDNQAANLILWPLDRFAPLRDALPAEWSAARFVLANQERIVVVLGQQSRLYDIASATFSDGPALPNDVGRPAVLSLDDNTLLLVGSSSVQLSLSGNQTVTQLQWSGDAPNGDGGEIVETGSALGLLLSANASQAHRLDGGTLLSTALTATLTPRSGWRAARVGALIWIVGGAPTGPLIQVLDPASDSVTAPTADPQQLPADLSDASVTAIDEHQALLIAGGQSAGQPRSTLLLLDRSCAATALCVLASADLKTARSGHSVTLLPEGRLLIAGGRDANGALGTAEIWRYTAQSLTFETTLDLIGARTDHTAIRLGGHEVVLLGGGEISGELFQPR